MNPALCRLRIVSCRWKPHVLRWHLTYALSEAWAKGARVEFLRDGTWEVRWP